MERKSCIFAGLLFWLTFIHANRTMVAYIEPSDVIQGENVTLVCDVIGSYFGSVSWLLAIPNTQITDRCYLLIDNGTFGLACQENFTVDPRFRQYNLTINHVIKSHHDGEWRCQQELGSSADVVLHVDVLISHLVCEDPGDYIVAEKSANLTCGTNLDVYPSPTVTWWKSNSSYPEVKIEITGQEYTQRDEYNPNTGLKYILEFTPSVSDHNYYIWCEAQQGNRSPEESNKRRLDVKFGPKQATADPPYVHGVIPYDINVTLTCTVEPQHSGNPNTYTFRWTGRGVTTGYIDTSTLTVNAVLENIDNYTCTPSNGIGDGMPASVQLDIFRLPEIENLTQSVTVLNTEHLEVICQYNSRPRAAIVWTNYNKTVYTESQQEDETNGDRHLLTRSQVKLEWLTSNMEDRKSGSGTVQCRASNTAGLQSSSVHINVQYAPGKPDFTLGSASVYAGEDVLMTCSYTSDNNGNPAVDKYIWLQAGNVVDTGVSNTKLVNVTSVNQESLYSCKMGNTPEAGPQVGIQSNTQLLTVNVKPYIFDPERDLNFSVLHTNENFYLECRGAGKPNIDFQWFFNHIPIDQPNPKYTQQDNDILGYFDYDLEIGRQSKLSRNIQDKEWNCDNLKMYDGTYQCQANHPGQQSSKSPDIYLTTFYPAHWAGDAETLTAVSPGSTVTLTCDVCVNPEGSTEWLYEGRPIRNNISVSEDGKKITISPVLLSDFGNYTCKVRNYIYGTSFLRTFNQMLLEKGRPHSPKNFHIVSTTSFSINVTWMPGFNGGFHQHFKLLYRANSSGDFIMWKDNIADNNGALFDSIHDLGSSTEYEIKLFSRNENDDEENSISEAQFIRVSTKAKPMVQIQWLQLSSLSVTLHWKIVSGKPLYLTLHHTEDEGTPSMIADDIDPLNDLMTVNGSFDLGKRNFFELSAYEPGRNDPSGGTADGPYIKEPEHKPTNKSDRALGAVIAVLCIMVVAFAGLAYFFWSKQRKANNNSSTESAIYQVPIEPPSSTAAEGDYTQLTSKQTSKADIVEYEDVTILQTKVL